VELRRGEEAPEVSWPNALEVARLSCETIVGTQCSGSSSGESVCESEAGSDERHVSLMSYPSDCLSDPVALPFCFAVSSAPVAGTPSSDEDDRDDGGEWLPSASPRASSLSLSFL
jgi:hypothetical protein